jgi:predicted metal-dependent hydrolase
VEKYAAIMGVFPEHVSINSAKTRFGSCSSKKRLNFSCRLMTYDERAIDYVVVHELAHLKHLNHSKDFWAFVEKFMPDYKERKKLLK